MAKHSYKNVRLDDFTKKVLEAAAKDLNLSQAEIVRDLIISKFAHIIPSLKEEVE